MKVRINESLGNTAAFDLVLIDGHENGEYPTNIQVDDSSDLISLAQDLGCPFVDDDDQPMPHPEGRHGIAYDFLSDHAKAQSVFAISEGYFDGEYGPYEHCRSCDGFHRLGYGGECILPGQRHVWTGDQMVPCDVRKRYAKIEVVVDFPTTISSEEAFDDWMMEMGKLMTDKGVRPLSSKILQVQANNPLTDI